MYFVLSVVLPLLILSSGECASVNNTQDRIALPYPNIISVNNGQIWGSWGPWESCPPGTYATGFSLKVEPNQGFWGDDTALNAIAIHCSKPIIIPGKVGPYTTITSTAGSWGSWTQPLWCPSGVLKAFQLQVESYQGLIGDDTAANNIRFTCTGNQVLQLSNPSWGNWGTWGGWSPVCGGTGICGIQTKVEPPQGIRDDSALNDVRFSCCY